MDDVLDTYLVRVMGAKPLKTKKLGRLKEMMGNLFSKAKARDDIANAIEEVTKKVKEIDERRRRYELGCCVPSPATPSPCIDPRIALVHRANKSQLVGIDERKDDVLKMLNGIKGHNTKVVSLYGFGGVGKTTLAKATYDQLKQEYECGAFVSVGQKPDLVKVFKDILFDLDRDKFKDIHSSQRGADFLIPQLLEFLGDRRYLIIIDDVRKTEYRKRITDSLANNDVGSTIIITTRNLDVAIGEVYKVQRLSEDNSKKLFYTRLFGGEDKCPNNQRQKISEAADKTLKKCGGIPLAIITMASLLVGKSMEEWFEVYNSIGFQGREKGKIGDTMWILSLSYYDLPSHLKTCLLYLSVFPEDYLIRKDTLIWMWIAEGFVNNGKPGTGLFETGEGYFNELVNRNLIQPIEERTSMIVEGCRVHDMILDLILSLSREANFATVLDKAGEEMFTGSNMARRLALQNRVVDTPQDNCMNTTRARSFIAVRCGFVPKVHQLQSFRLLRVLHLEGCHDVCFGKEHVGELHHLRYLGSMHDGYIGGMELPKEIGALKFLRVLYLDDNFFGLLPSSVGMLTELVCLHATRMDLPCGIIKDLTSLQELQIGRSRYDDKSRGQFAKDLCNLSDLRVLTVKVYGMDERTKSDLFTSIGSLHMLQHLELGARYDGGLPSCIGPSHLPKLSHLSLTLRSLGDQGLKILGDLAELCYLYLHHTNGHATLTGTAACNYFRKLRSCSLAHSTVQFVVSEEDSSVSFSIWDAETRDDAPAFSSKRMQESSRVARGAIMPNLEALYFMVDVEELTACNNGSCNNLGLEYLDSVQKVTVTLVCPGAHIDVVEREKDALRHTFLVHPNRPTLEFNNRDSSKSGGDDLGKEDDDNKEELLSTLDEGVTHQSRRSEEEEDELTTQREDSSGIVSTRQLLRFRNRL